MMIQHTESDSDELNDIQFNKAPDPKVDHIRSIKDSGCRRHFESGAVRDICEGKGRMDLIPIDVVAELIHYFYVNQNPNIVNTDDRMHYIYHIVDDVRKYLTDPKNDLHLIEAIYMFCIMNGWSIFKCILEVSIQYEEGAKKYGENNWQKGIPLHCYIDSALRHFMKFNDGWVDEPHDRAFVWNLIGAIWTIRHKPELIDIGSQDSSECDQP